MKTDKKDKLINILKLAKCPNANCDNKGCITTQVIKTGTRWVDDGKGNPLPEPIPIQNFEMEPCQWCDERDELIKYLESELAEQEQEEKHETCDGCQMFAECGCMLDDSCQQCVEHDMWTPKEQQKPQRTAEK